jgi:hypothetical protein
MANNIKIAKDIVVSIKENLDKEKLVSILLNSNSNNVDEPLL